MKKSISNIQRNSSPSLSMKGPTTPYRSTQMKATSFTAKQQGSTSASPWWTSSRNASGYLKECLRRHWKKRVKTRVSLASLGPPPSPSCPSIRPTATPSTCPKHNTGVQSSTICNCHLFLLHLFWFDSLHLDSPCPHAEPWDCLSSRRQIDSFAHPHSSSSAPSSDPKGPLESQQRLMTWHDVLEYTDWFNRKLSPVQQDGPAPQQQWRESISSHTDYQAVRRRNTL